MSVEEEPFPGSEKGRRLTDEEVKALGYTHRDETGRWVLAHWSRRGV